MTTWKWKLNNTYHDDDTTILELFSFHHTTVQDDTNLRVILFNYIAEP